MKRCLSSSHPFRIRPPLTRCRPEPASAGRLLIPREIRREAGLEPDTPLDVRWRDGVIEIEPQPLAVKLEKRGRLIVAMLQGRVSTLKGGSVERTGRAVRHAR